MIIADVFILHLPTMVGQIGVVTKIHPNWKRFYIVMEKLQIVGFTVQETIISGIYIYKAWTMVKESYNDHTKQCMNPKSSYFPPVICCWIYPYVWPTGAKGSRSARLTTASP